MPDRTPPRDEWTRLKPSTESAVQGLSRKLGEDASSEELIEAYLYAKRLLAESMRAFVRMGLPERCEEFHRRRARIGEEMRRRYSGTIPDAYLVVPYGSRVHEELFCVLFQRLGEQVPGGLLRTVTADSVHTERRIRELRELGFDIVSTESEGVDYYTLTSTEPSPAKIPSLIKNTAHKKRYKEMTLKALVAVFEAEG